MSEREKPADWEAIAIDWMNACKAARAEVAKLQARIAGLEKSLHHERHLNMVREEEQCDEERGYQL